MSKYKKYREALLAESPYCSNCGAEATGKGRGKALEYHHTTPQYTMTNTHGDGILLCPPCHSAWHALDRRQHLTFDARGNAQKNYNPYKPRKNTLELSAILNYWTK